MSAPTADASFSGAPESAGADASAQASAQATAPAPTRALTVLLVALGLAAIALAVVAFFRIEAGEIDARKELEGLFEPFEMPHGLVLDRALRFPQGVRAIVFTDPAAEPEPAAAPASESPAPPDPGAPRFDWTKVAVGETVAPPRRVTLLVDAPRESLDAARATGGPGGARSLKTLGPEGGVLAIELGKIRWHEFNADFVHERRYERGGTFVDSVRVNLSANGRACTLHTQWTRGHAGSRAQVEAILARLRPQPAA